MRNGVLKSILLCSLIFICSCAGEKSNEDLIRYNGIDRSLSILYNSTPEQPNELDIFFYGQSIVGGMKSSLLVDSLKKIFPSVKINHSNKAIGGFTAPSLIKTAEHDLYHKNPDLVVFHAYNGIKDGIFDSLIRTIRSRMSSEILLFDHHYIWDTSQTRLKSRNIIDSIESLAIKKIAKKYDCGYVNLREQWANYLEDNNLGVNVLIGDTINPEVHPNDEGDKLLRDIIISRLLDSVSISNNYNPGKDKLRQTVSLRKGKRLHRKEFTGNRVELALDTIVDKDTKIQVLVDGEPPSSFRSSYYVTRPSIGFKSWMPMIKKITLGKTFPRTEEWELTFCEIDREKRTFNYEVAGSITGFDGKGDSNSDFESNSKRIIINKEDFYLFDIERIIQKETPANFKVKFKVIPVAKDTITLNPNILKYTLFRSFENEKHSLKLKILNGDTRLKELLVYRPYLERDEQRI